MKSKFYLSLLSIFSVLVFQNCQESPIEKLVPPEELIGRISVAEEEKLLKGLDYLQAKTPVGARVNQSKIDKLRLDSVIRRIDPKTGSTNYSFFVEESRPYSLTNLVITENKGAYLAFFVEYISANPKAGWNLVQFQGKVKLTSIDGKVWKIATIAPSATSGRTDGWSCSNSVTKITKSWSGGSSSYFETEYACSFIESNDFGDISDSGNNVTPGMTGINDNGTSPEPTRIIDCDQLKNMHGESAKSAMDFWRINQGLTREQIIKQRPDRSVTGIGSQEGGPDIRYVNDILNPKNIIDLRHMLVIGYYGRAVGESVEMMQWLQNNESGYDSQDFYSNELGYKFYSGYGAAIQANPTAFADYLISFLNNPSLRNEVSNPPHCK